MKIQNISIYNYRSLLMIESVKFTGFDIFIGQNDAGKSSFLQALVTFFNPKDNFLFEKEGTIKTDLSTKSKIHTQVYNTDTIIGNNEIGVIIKFGITSQDKKNTEIEYIRNLEDEEVVILKKGNRDGFGYFLLTKEPENKTYSNLYQKKSTELKDIFASIENAKDYLVNTNDSGKPTNNEYIMAINKALEVNGEEYTLRFIEIDIKKEPIFPIFEIVESHGNIDGTNKIIDSAFKIVGEQLIKNHKDSENYKLFHKGITEKYDKMALKIFDYAKTHYLRDLVQVKANPFVNFTITKELLIQRNNQSDLSHFDNQGDGTKRRLMVAMLQCANELSGENEESHQQQALFDDEISNISEPYIKQVIWAFDEPELHLHPGAQRDLFESLKKFSGLKTQIICSTHSTIFVDRSNFEGSHLFILDSNGITTVGSNSNGETILNEIGARNSDIFFASKIILVEGETEENALPLFYRHLKGKNMSDEGIQIVCTKGSDKLAEIAEVILENFNNSIALIDKDSKSKIVHLESTDKITYIGEVADFEDAFNAGIWTKLLNTNFLITDSDFTWSDVIIEELIGNIIITENNKKLLKLIENKYKLEWRSSHEEGDYGYDKHFNKPTIGKLLAEISIQENKIPQTITDFINSL